MEVRGTKLAILVGFLLASITPINCDPTQETLQAVQNSTNNATQLPIELTSAKPQVKANGFDQKLSTSGQDQNQGATEAPLSSSNSSLNSSSSTVSSTGAVYGPSNSSSSQEVSTAAAERSSEAEIKVAQVEAKSSAVESSDVAAIATDDRTSAQPDSNGPTQVSLSGSMNENSAVIASDSPGSEKLDSAAHLSDLEPASSPTAQRHGRSSHSSNLNSSPSYTPPSASRLSAYSSSLLANPNYRQIGADTPIQTSTRAPETPFDPVIVCYLGSWSVYRPSLSKFTPENINPFLCTHIIYAFAGISSKFELKPHDSNGDITQGGYRKFTGLKDYNKQLKTMIAVGGWNEGSAR